MPGSLQFQISVAQLENQRYRPHPILIGYEATYTRRFRGWSAQFYPGGQSIREGKGHGTDV